MFQKFGCENAEIMEALENGDIQNPLAIAYRLIIDNKRMSDESALDEFRWDWPYIRLLISFSQKQFAKGNLH